MSFLPDALTSKLLPLTNWWTTEEQRISGFVEPLQRHRAGIVFFHPRSQRRISPALFYSSRRLDKLRSTLYHTVTPPCFLSVSLDSCLYHSMLAFRYG